MGKNYFFQKISVLLLFFIGLINANAQISVDQAEITSGGWYRTIVSGENISFPAAAQTASSFSFIIRNTGATSITLTGTPIVQISGTNASSAKSGSRGALLCGAVYLG